MIKIPDVEKMPTEGGMTWTARSRFVDGYRVERFNMLMSHLTKFETAVDVGSHVGSWSIELSKKFNMVFAYEPNLQSFELLKSNISDSGQAAKIIPYNLAVGASSKSISMSAGQKGPISSMVDEATTGDVKMTTLDEEGLRDVSLIKIHCNGYELEVLRGAEHLIDRDLPEIFVVMKKNKRVESNVEMVVSLLARHGYEVKYANKPDWLFSYTGVFHG